MLQVMQQMKAKNRMLEFAPLRDFSIELRSSNALLSQLQAFPAAVREYSPEETRAAGQGRLTIQTELAPPHEEKDAS
jgi:hypothetical protein